MRIFFTSLAIAFLAFPASALELKSNTITEGGTLALEQVYNGFGCKGDNISPHLSWSDAPEGTKSYALTMYDPDAPTGSGWWHWVVFNIDESTTELPAGVGKLIGSSPLESAGESRTDFGTKGYGGACPPEGDKPHRYEFTIYALDTEYLDLSVDSSGALIGYYINAHKLAEDTITAYYGR